MANTPVTERANELSNQADLLSPEEFVRILRQADSQVFSGWRQYPGLLDPSTIQTLVHCSEKIAEVLRDPQTGVIVLSGCGTSGRVAFLTSRYINRLLTQLNLPSCVQCTISGGDRALICSDELPEDDPLAGVKEMQTLVQGKSKVVYIGISCGISAPYVAGQVDFSMRQSPASHTTVIMGFNPLEYARKAPVELWNGRSFFDVVQEFTQLQKQHAGHHAHLVLNPVVGPEVITGSSRMKGGSTTKILLDTMFALAFQKVFSNVPTADGLGQFLSTWRLTYQAPDAIAAVVELAGNCLSSGGRLFYVGDEEMGLIGLMDVSEMPDTFGQPPSRIRAFLRGGWTSVGARTGNLATQFPKEPIFQITLGDFCSDIVPSLTSKDAVIVCTSEPNFASLGADLQRCWTEAAQKGAQVASVAVFSDKIAHGSSVPCVRIALPCSSLIPGDGSLASMAMKWVLNAISTGANVRSGMVVGNDMVNVTVANDKIYRRAVRIVAQHSSTSLQAAEEALLKAIYQTNDVADKMTLPVSQHCIRATQLYETRLVPQAIVLAHQGCSLQEAAAILETQHNVRLALNTLQRSKRPRLEEGKDSQVSML